MLLHGSFAAVFLKMFILNVSLDLGMFLPPHKFVKVRKLVRHSLSLGFAAIPVATIIHAVYRLLHVTGSTNVNEWLTVEWLYTNIKTLAIYLLNDAEIFPKFQSASA